MFRSNVAPTVVAERAPLERRPGLQRDRPPGDTLGRPAMHRPFDAVSEHDPIRGDHLGLVLTRGREHLLVPRLGERRDDRRDLTETVCVAAPHTVTSLRGAAHQPAVGPGSNPWKYPPFALCARSFPAMT